MRILKKVIIHYNRQNTLFLTIKKRILKISWLIGYKIKIHMYNLFITGEKTKMTILDQIITAHNIITGLTIIFIIAMVKLVIDSLKIYK